MPAVTLSFIHIVPTSLIVDMGKILRILNHIQSGKIGERTKMLLPVLTKTVLSIMEFTFKLLILQQILASLKDMCILCFGVSRYFYYLYSFTLYAHVVSLVSSSSSSFLWFLL